MTTSDEITFIYGMISHQDFNLQSYRSLHITMHSISLAVAIGLTVFIFSVRNPTTAFLIYLVLAILAAQSFFVFYKMQKMLYRWETNVDFLVTELLKLEKDSIIAPSKRYHTVYRIRNMKLEKGIKSVQRINITDAEIDGITFEYNDIRSLASAGIVRRTLNKSVFQSILVVWLILFTMSTVQLLLIFSMI